MDDGIVLRADVFRPDASGRYPVIMTHGPYGKWLAFQDGFARQWANLEAEHRMRWPASPGWPSHLAAICPWEGGSDFYRDFCRHGGIFNIFVRQWYPPQVAGVEHGIGERGLRHRAQAAWSPVRRR